MTVNFALAVLLLSAVDASSAMADIATDASDPLQAACAAMPREEPILPGIAVTDEPVAKDGLHALRATNEENGAYLLIFYENGTEAVARARAACLGKQVAQVAQQVGDDRTGAQWSSVVFTQDPNYQAPLVPGEATRWPVTVQADGTLDRNGRSMISYVMPHEQVHAYQGREGAHLPRWLAEGHARWVQEKLVHRFDPAMADWQKKRMVERAAQSEGPLQLTGWDQQRIKREAYLRQVSPEERAKMEDDPDYQPAGVFSFRDDDFEEEYVANDQARYLASEAIVVGLEERHGTAAVNEWIADLTAAKPGRILEETVDTSLQAQFGETLDQVLGDAR